MLTEGVEALDCPRMPLITFEGVEGSGKTTQLHRTMARLAERGISAFQTREPGGTGIGERIRDILLDPANTHLDPVAEWLLYEADRRQHVEEVLRPALAAGRLVLCDRYSDTTEAYQLKGRGVDADAVRRVDALARNGVVPDYTLIFDIEPRKGLARAWERDGRRAGRFEAAEIGFHERVREAYRAIARREPGRVTLVPADAAEEEVFEKTWDLLSRRFGL